VHLFAEVNVRRDGVLEKLRQQIAAHKQQHRYVKGIVASWRRCLPQFDRARQYLEYRDREHESRTDGEKIFEIFAVAPLKLRREKDRPAKDISGTGTQAEDNEANEQWVHRQ